MKPEKLRQHGRTPFPAAVRLCWDDGRGNLYEVRGKGIDRSPSGLRLEVSEPVPAKAVVLVHAGGYGAVGSAWVRHCARRGARFTVGLEFTQAVRWKDDPGAL